METSLADLRRCVAENDVKSLKKILDTYRIYTNGTNLFTDEKKRVLSTLLMYASAYAKNDALDEEFSGVLIERVAMLVEIYDFLNAMMIYLDYQPREFEESYPPPRRLIEEMHRAFPNNSIHSLTRSMAKEQFMYLAELMSLGEFSDLNRECSAPVLLYCYNNKVIPHDVCLSYIANCLMRIDSVCWPDEDKCPFGDDEEDLDI